MELWIWLRYLILGHFHILEYASTARIGFEAIQPPTAAIVPRRALAGQRLLVVLHATAAACFGAPRLVI